MILCIDTCNSHASGDVNHPADLLNAVDSRDYNFTRVIARNGKAVLEKIDDRSWIQKINDPLLNRGLPYRVFW